MRRLQGGARDPRLPSLFHFCILPLLCYYYLFLYIPILVACKMYEIASYYVLLVVSIICRRSTHARHMFVHLSAMIEIVHGGIKKATMTSYSDMAIVVIQTIYEVRSSFHHYCARCGITLSPKGSTYYRRSFALGLGHWHQKSIGLFQ
jgi:hypothetical protein